MSQYKVSIRNVVLLAVPIGLLVYLGLWYLPMSRSRFEPEAGNPFRSFLKHNLIAPSQLDKGLVDDNGDLIASMPKDPAKQIEPETLVFAVLGQDLDKEESRYQELAEHLGKKTGKKVDVVIWTDSVPLQLAALRDGTLHIAAFSTGTVSAAVNNGGFVPFCVMADDKGKFGYETQLIVPASSPVQSPAELKDTRIAFVSPYSHSGFKAPVLILWKEFKLLPGVDYTPSFERNQEEVVTGVSQDRLKAGAVASDLLKRKIASGEIDGKSVRVIYTSKSAFPPQCFGYAHQLKPDLVEKIKEGFLDFPWKGTALEEAYAPAGQTRFVPITYKTDWQSVREMEAHASDFLNELK